MTQTVKEELLQVYRAAKFELAEFGSIGPNTTGVHPLPENEKQVTSFILSRTQLYRDSWLLRPLREAMLQLGYEEEIRQIEQELAADPRTHSNKAVEKD